MIYRIEVEKRVHKQLDKIKDKTIQKDIKNKIRQLKYNPRKGKHLFRNYYELKAKNYRIYYAIFRGMIVIENITYAGTVTSSHP